MTLAPGRYRPSEVGVSILNGDHARLLVLDVPIDSNGYRPGRKTFDYKPMEGESYYVIVTPHDEMLWKPENVEEPT